MKDKYRLYSSLPMTDLYKAYAEIDLEALKYNYNTILREVKKSAGDCEIICVLKADAYGHGAKECCRALLEEGCGFFAVSSVEEAIEIRKTCDECGRKAEILVLGYTFPNQAYLLWKYNIITALVDKQFAFELAKEAKRLGAILRCHVKLDTGMNRVGFSACNASETETAAGDIFEVGNLESIDICGMFTHFFNADGGEAGKKQTDRQMELFEAVDGKLLELGLDVGFRHVCNTAATFNSPEYHMDGCRIGIALYGSESNTESSEIELRPVMKLCTYVSHIHTLNAGDSVSYGGEYIAETDRVIATLPIGYADGFIRAYKGAKLTLVTDDGIKKAPVVGRICMDQCMIDVTDLGVSVGDKVIIFGNTRDELTELARLADTIEYEVLCLITSRIPRIY